MVEFGPANASALSSKTRATLLARLQDASDALAWDEFFQRYWRLIYAYARRCNCSEHTAEEVVQDVMLKVFEQKDLFHYDPARTVSRLAGHSGAKQGGRIQAQAVGKDARRRRQFGHRTHRTAIRQC